LWVSRRLQTPHLSPRACGSACWEAGSAVDHNMLQTGFRNADDHCYLQSVAAKYGTCFSRPGNGICHQVHMQRFGIPGKTLLGSDSHTPTDGGLGVSPGANLGDGLAVFEPAHGSAPTYAGQNKLNPTVTILSGAMMLALHR